MADRVGAVSTALSNSFMYEGGKSISQALRGNLLEEIPYFRWDAPVRIRISNRALSKDRSIQYTGRQVSSVNSRVSIWAVQYQFGPFLEGSRKGKASWGDRDSQFFAGGVVSCRQIGCRYTIANTVRPFPCHEQDGFSAAGLDFNIEIPSELKEFTRIDHRSLALFLQHYVIPASFPDGFEGLTIVPMVLEGIASHCNAGRCGRRSQTLQLLVDTSVEICKAVSDEQDVRLYWATACSQERQYHAEQKNMPDKQPFPSHHT